MPAEKASRYVKEMGLTEVDAVVLTDSLDVARYFEACVAAGAAPVRAGNWVRTEVLRAVNERHADADSLAVKPQALAELILRVEDGKLSTTLARHVFDKMLEGLSLEEAVKKSGAVEGGMGGNALEDLVRATLDANPDVLEEIRSGKDVKGKKIKFLQGLVMREAKGQARPDEVASAIEKALR
jgi:aspartyl-tRNA(Asn)/glutamyl-tRNA(Gln) amidotransferase subunit B